MQRIGELMKRIDRREFMRLAAATGAALSVPVSLLAATENMHTRTIPSTGQKIGIVGYGNTSDFYKTDEEQRERISQLMQSFVQSP